MRLDETPPRGWDARIAFPLQSKGFAEASRALGYRPLFVHEDDGLALVLTRQVPVPLIARWTGRAKVYAHAERPSFLPALATELGRRGISHVRLGDSAWGPSGVMPERWTGARPLTHHRFVHDLTIGDAALLARATRMIRRHLRKAADDVTVTTVSTPADLRDYLQLTAETGTRMRGRDVAAVYPPAYLQAIFREMVPRGQAVLFLARAGDAPLAAATFVTNGDRFTQIHGCSTRDRRLTPKQGPTFLFWHAMRYASARGHRTFDMGAVTPTDDPTHPHYSVFEYKKRWGGRLARTESVELVVSAWKHRLQEALLAPMWDRLHPVYLQMFGHRPLGPVPAPSLLDLARQEQRL
jgi:hypothetical protein